MGDCFRKIGIYGINSFYFIEIGSSSPVCTSKNIVYLGVLITFSLWYISGNFLGLVVLPTGGPSNTVIVGSLLGIPSISQK